MQTHKSVNIGINHFPKVISIFPFKWKREIFLRIFYISSTVVQYTLNIFRTCDVKIHVKISYSMMLKQLYKISDNTVTNLIAVLSKSVIPSLLLQVDINMALQLVYIVKDRKLNHTYHL